MEWLNEIVRTGAGVGLGVLVGVAVTRGRAGREQLLEGYTDYCANVVEVLFKDDVNAARMALLRVSYAAHRIELLESSKEAIVATGMLCAKCSYLVSVLSEEPVRSDVARLRAEISSEYWNVVDLVRERFGGEALVIQDAAPGPKARRHEAQGGG